MLKVTIDQESSMSSFDMTVKYNLMVVTDYYSEPDYVLYNLTAHEVMRHIEEEHIPDHKVYITNAATGMLCGLKYQEDNSKTI